MNKTVAVLSALAVAACLGCGDHVQSVTLSHGRLRIFAHEVTIERSGGAAAHLLEGGVLKIGSDEQALNPEQKALVESYYAAALSITKHGIETGKAGAEVGATAAKEVVSGLVHGDTSQIGAKVEASAEKVKEKALKICDDLTAMRTAQESLASSLPAFEPYRAVSESDVADCAKDIKH